MMTAHIVLDGGEKLVDGRSSILFACIAGMSLALMTGGATPSTVAALRKISRMRLVIRASLLLAVGLLLTVLSPPLAVILDDYGLWFLLLIPLLFLKRRWLAVACGLVIVLGPLLLAAVNDAIAADPVFDETDQVLYWLGEWWVTGAYPAVEWVAFPIAGIAIARSDLRRTSTRASMLVGGALVSIVGYGSAALIPGVTAEAHSGTAAEILGSGGFAVAVVGLLLLIVDGNGRVSRTIRALLWPVSAAGSMPLTIYTSHVIGMAIASRVATAVSGEDRDYAPWLLPLMIAGALILGSVLRATIGAGPLERLVSRWSGLGSSARPPTPPRRPRSSAAPGSGDDSGIPQAAER